MTCSIIVTVLTTLRMSAYHQLLMALVCLQVFRLDAVQSSDSASARRQLQNYLASLSSFRGRALMGPIAMPPTLRALPPPQAEVQFFFLHPRGQ